VRVHIRPKQAMPCFFFVTNMNPLLPSTFFISLVPKYVFISLLILSLTWSSFLCKLYSFHIIFTFKKNINYKDLKIYDYHIIKTLNDAPSSMMIKSKSNPLVLYLFLSRPFSLTIRYWWSIVRETLWKR